MHVAFALTAGGPDAFCAMTAVAAHAVRRLHPDAAVTICTDERTAAAGVADPPWWPDGVRFVTVETGMDSPVARNRFVKTKLRDVLDGPFLYLDGDALPVRPLDGLFADGPGGHGADFAGVPNRYRGAAFAQFPPESRPDYDRLGWDVPAGPYVNGGVWYCGDTDAARHFGETYHALWRRFHEVTGSPKDQAALNAALDRSGVTAAALPLRFNAFVDAAPCFARGAHVWHFFCRGGGPAAGSLLAALTDRMRADGRVDWDLYDAAADRDDAWLPDAPGRAGVLEKCLHEGRSAARAGDFEAAWRFVSERVRRKPLSHRTWLLAAGTAARRLNRSTTPPGATA